MKHSSSTAIVTGGGSGIGQAIAIALAAQGHRVAIADLDLTSAKQTQALIAQNGGSAFSVELNVADAAQVNQVFSDIASEHGIDILINNAGIGAVGTIEETSEAELDKLYSVNVKGVYHCSLTAIAAMKAQQSGVIINMASVASSVGIADRFAYSMTKGAVLTMTYSIAKDYLHDNIRCNCVSPGRVHTPFVDAFLEKNYPDNKEEMFDKLSKTQPIGRMGSPDEVASIVTYLCSPQAAFITGSNFPVDGGFVTLNN
ncbi:SDR family oxidoreductase [Thalassotalea euphylliae]|uniref:SDR family oxidoreductase n=1 Tax=Thalassotalea euphylliae TaxID=1655234 RepID=A0A3E0TTZ6_9GAMM|nr:SDR family oxidoreductase [Thalassotalea euphylliae]REL27442.1 SDR family oxidoreductase [Thalassotalea euphylliae]